MPERVRKPEWLKISIGANERYTETKRIVESHCLHTICSSGRCPNMGECWGKGTATFMIGGNICTRCCKFCNTASGKPLPLDADEPTHVAESIALMKLSHAVVTSVDRDDLPDLGASHWVRTIREIKRLNPDTTVEVLIPDFRSLAQSHHNAGLGGSIAFCNLPQHFQACFILGGTAYEGADTTDSLHVVRNDFRLCIDDLCHEFLSSLEVGNQHFDGGVRVEPLDFPCSRHLRRP